MTKFTAFFGGAGIGVLIGVLIGMTTSGIVGAIIGTLTTVILAYFNNKEEHSEGSKSLRIGAFGIFCVIGILTGLYLRVQNTFLPSPTNEIEKWMKDSMFTKSEAKAYYLYDRFGFLPNGFIIDTTRNRRARQTELYSTEQLESDCEQLEAYNDFPIKNKLDAYARLHKSWKKEIDTIRKITQNTDQQEQLLEALKNRICND